MLFADLLIDDTTPTKKSPGCASGSVDGTSTTYPTASSIAGRGSFVIFLGISVRAIHIISGASYAYSSISSVPTDE